MEAGDITLNDVRRLAVGIKELALTLSFIQVELGLVELEGCWDGFCEASNYYGIHYDDERDCALQFGFSAIDVYGLSELVPG